MNLARFFKVIAFLTLGALVYINLQMQIVDLAYQGKKKEAEIRRLQDGIGHLSYNILTMKSASHLGDKLLKENSTMKFVDKKNIVTLQTKPSRSLIKKKSLTQKEKKPNVLLSLFSLKSQAQAQALEIP